MLVLAVKDPRVQRLAGGEVAVEYKTGRGIQRFGGILQLDAGRPEQLRVITARARPSASSAASGRASRRILPISVKGIDEPVGGETQTLNVSGGGVLVKDKWNMPLGTDVRIELQAEPGGPPIQRPRPRRPRRRHRREGHADRLDLARGRGAPGASSSRERELAALRMSRGR